jgi:site-specific DNA-methyltransferase (adenine-specific)
LIGAFGKVNHGGAVSNWEAGRNIPSRLQYKKICNALIETGKIKSLPEYEDAIRPFKVDASKEFTDVWNFPSVRPFKDKHPAEKPASLLEHAIFAASYEGDIVLDCFSGSGSTGIAARKLGRLAVLIDLDPLWIKNSALRIMSTSNIKELEKEESNKEMLQTFSQQSKLF